MERRSNVKLVILHLALSILHSAEEEREDDDEEEEEVYSPLLLR